MLGDLLVDEEEPYHCFFLLGDGVVLFLFGDDDDDAAAAPRRLVCVRVALSILILVTIPFFFCSQILGVAMALHN